MKPAFSTPKELAAIARKAGTPCFVYAPFVARDRMTQLLQLAREAAGNRIRIAYSVKTNPRTEVLRLLKETGCQFAVSSAGELARLTDLEIPGERILFSGPGKRQAEIESALVTRVRIVCEGERDLRHVDAWAAERGKEVPILLRINPLGPTTGSVTGSPGPSRFGVDEGILDTLLSRWREGHAIRISGVLVATASNLCDAEELASHHRSALRLARQLQETTGLKLDTIDLGGGLGIPYGPDEEELDVPRVLRNLEKMLEGSPWFTGTLLLEPGRWISAPCAIYVAQVLEVKWSQKTRFAVLDGGIHHLLRPALGRQGQPAFLLPRADGSLATGRQTPTTFGGPLGLGLDILARDISCGDIEEGDLIAFLQAGAYGETQSMQDFSLHPKPRVVMVTD